MDKCRAGELSLNWSSESLFPVLNALIVQGVPGIIQGVPEIIQGVPAADYGKTNNTD